MTKPIKFSEKRLKEVREARMLTATELANRINVTRQSVWQYENKKQTPKSEVLEKLCRELDVPVSAFFAIDDSGDPAPAVFYRSFSSATKQVRRCAEVHYEWLKRLTSLIEDYVELPEVQIPQCNYSADPAEIHDDEIERAAIAARRTWGLGNGAISNIAWLLENHGVVVARRAMSSAALDAFSDWPHTQRRPFVILSSNKQSAVRSRFDASHELGHLILHRNVPHESLRRKDVHSLVERQASLFASAFLLPAETFSGDFYAATLDAFMGLKAKWKVAIAAMIVRARQLDLITDQRSTQLWKAYSARGWRRKEPLDAVIKAEQPRMIRKSLDLLFDAGVLTRHDIPAHLSLPAFDVENAAGLPQGYLGRATTKASLKRDLATAIEEVEEVQLDVVPFRHTK